MKPTQATYVPSHPESMIVDFGLGQFDSFLKATRNFDAGETIAPLTGLTRGPKRYTTVQCGAGEDDHVELNSDLVFVNHSCKPNAAFDLSSVDPSLWVFRALKAVVKGGKLTFFYPSTEWDMDQSFVCECKSARCIGRIRGAKHLPRSTLAEQLYVSPWIEAAINARDDIAEN